ncbi:IclR family transcriptional regulator [Rhodococcus sp. NPDC127530]|uniref:IclR family transcriptional regulator n=1 Tax=unclassified Rhodococcus (in: high G+C Gram-positive bacteria) TaxID=192944 RepID=UPI00363F00FB
MAEDVAAERGVVSAPGTQTLARGLTALQLVADSDGLTVQEIADRVGVHRTVAYRLLSTLASFRYIIRGEDGRYRPAAALVALGNSFDRSVRQKCMPILQRLVADQRATVALLVAEGDEAVSVAVIVPRDVNYHLSFREGSRHPLDRGAAGVALRAALPPRPDDAQAVMDAREKGWVITYGEIEPSTYGLAVPVRRPTPGPPICINLITHRADLAEASTQAVIRAASDIEQALR